jgi:hypothetical protein
MRKADYNRRAAECLAFAKTSRDEDERTQMLLMATRLRQLAIQRQNKPDQRKRKSNRQVLPLLSISVGS